MTTQIANPDADYAISPESLEIASTYLACHDAKETAQKLGIELEKVTHYLRKPDVKRFIDTIFLEQGYMNRGRMQEVMDRLFELKMEEIEESEVGTSKDILDLITVQHKMRMDEIAALAKANGGGTTIRNTTINKGTINNGFGPNYEGLLGKLQNAGND